MANNGSIFIEASDCSRINVTGENEGILRFLFKNHSCPSIFRISPNPDKTPEPIINFDFKTKQWFAGRYIGNYHFEYNDLNVYLKIVPRFGNTILYKMFSELFNIQFTRGSALFNSVNDSYYLKVLIAFIWLQKLSNANRHGLPKTKSTRQNCSLNQKGKIVIARTALTSCTSGKIFSEYKDKCIDKLVVRILYQAFHILKSDYKLGELKFPLNAIEAIHVLEENSCDFLNVSLDEYLSVKYHPIYQNFKDIVDFSWQIIKAKHGFEDGDSKSNIQGFFLDMAEIWECFLRNNLKRMVELKGWKLISNIHEVYADRFYRRRLIPDIVFRRNNDFLVFDAKYKHMRYSSYDIDREDFFQIHTYISFLQSKGNVILGGLIYPLLELNRSMQTFSPYFSSGKSFFMIDGPLIEKDCIQFEGFQNRLLETIAMN